MERAHRAGVTPSLLRDRPAGSARYFANNGQNHSTDCLAISAYEEVGVYERDIAMTKFWQNDGLVWSEGVKRMDLVIKDGTGTKAHTHPDPEKFFPTKAWHAPEL
jgi:hypothetical protein